MAALLLLAVLAQPCVSWPMEGGWIQESIKETGAEGEYGVFLSTKACKPILVVSQNKIMNLIMSKICLIW